MVKDPAVEKSIPLHLYRQWLHQGVAGGKLRYDAIAMFLTRKISLFVFCPGTLPGIRPFFPLKSGNCGEKFPILPLLGNLEIGRNWVFHNWEALPSLNLGAYRIISQLPSRYPFYPMKQDQKFT